MNIEIPDGQYLDSIDMTGDTPTPIFKEYPPSKIELLEEDNIKQQADIDYLMLLLE